MELLKKIKKKALLIFLVICTNIAFFIDVKNLNNINKLSLWQNEFLSIAIFSYVIYQIYKKTDIKKLHFKIISIIFTLFLLIGKSYSNFGNMKLLNGGINYFFIFSLSFIGYFVILKIIINKVYNFIPKFSKFKTYSNKLLDLIYRYPFRISLVILLILWLPYIIAFYPTILSPDPSNQIKQFFNMPTHYINGVVLLDENVLLTNHHPFMHTLLLGGCLKLGRFILNDNFGLFIYSIIQLTILLFTLSYTIKYMKKININKIYVLITLLIYGLVPVFPMYGMSAVKDTMFGCFIIIYIIQLFDIIYYNKTINLKNFIILSINLLLIMLIRNNGIYTIILSFPLLFLVVKKQRLKILIILFLSIGIYKTYDKVILPSFKITPGSIREVLSIPFQQTARLAKVKENAFSKNDILIVDKILNFKTLKDRYKENIADPVKNKFNKNATKKDLNQYFYVWHKGLLKYPNIYIDATINNTYGYFYPNTEKWYVYYKYDSRLKETNKFDYHYNNLEWLRKFLSSYGISFPYIPFIGLIVNIAISTWIILLLGVFLIKDKQYKYLVCLSPSISLILVCFASPVNTYFRYALPQVFALPLLIAIYIKLVESRKKNEKNSRINTML